MLLAYVDYRVLGIGAGWRVGQGIIYDCQAKVGIVYLFLIDSL
ncbi:hypothetical protein ES703_96671 [subsurface metagenome]